jgi:glycosyltransferase involved in cell wall biosynthesis
VFLFDMTEVPFTEPWKESLESRIEKLQSRAVKIAYLYEAPAKNTFRYRVYNMVQAVNACCNDMSASYFSNEEWCELDKILSSLDVFVVSRVRYTGELNQLLTRARGLGKKVFYDIDDLIFDPDYTHLIVHSLDLPRTDQTWDHWFAFISRIRAAMKLCDQAITTNQFLADNITGYFHKPAHVIPNFMNDEQLSISRRIMDRKRDTAWRRDDTITLGYFSGTQTHNKDFQIASAALAQLFRSDDRLRLRIGGHLAVQGPIAHFSDRIERLPFTDFVNLQTSVGRVDINIVPLQQNIFSNCKSELKYFEAAVVGTITVATPTYTYANAITDGETGFLAESYAWHNKLQQAIQVSSVPDGRYIEMAESAAASVLGRFTGESQSGSLQTLFANGNS